MTRWCVAALEPTEIDAPCTLLPSSYPDATIAGVAGPCRQLTGDCFSSDLTSFLTPCRLALKLSIVLIISFILFFFVRLSSLRYWSGELNHSPYFMSRLISITSASSTCQCASRLLSTLTRSDL